MREGWQAGRPAFHDAAPAARPPHPGRVMRRRRAGGILVR